MLRGTDSSEFNASRTTPAQVALWAQFKQVVAKNRVVSAFMLLAGLAPFTALALLGGDPHDVAILAECAATSVALGLVYLGDRRAGHAAVAQLSGRWLLSGYALVLANTWLVSVGQRDIAMAMSVPPMTLLLLALALPALFDWWARIGAVTPLLRSGPRWGRSREALYLGALIALLVFFAYPRGLALPWIVLGGISALLRRTLWKREHPLWIRVLPHTGVFGFGVVWSTLSIAPGVLTPYADQIVGSWVLTLAITMLVGVVYWTAQRVRRQVVDSPTGPQSFVHDSIQSREAAYCDVHGFVERLIATIVRSDAGVFGLTGVRGAGKSALARRVLHELRPTYFTLEVTSPARHDSDMGFFLSVCRGVAQRVRDDLHDSFDPQPGVFGVLARSVRSRRTATLATRANGWDIE